MASKYIRLKDTFKKKYGLDLVLMEGPKETYSAYDEDSEFIKKFMTKSGQTIFKPALAKDIFSKDDFVN